jgi:hypothetical protein
MPLSTICDPGCWEDGNSKTLSWKCRRFRCRPLLVLKTCLCVFPTRRPDTADVSATSCDVGFFFSVLYVMSLPNCRHVVVVTTYHSIILAKRMVRNHRNQPQTTLFFSNNNMVKGGCPNGRPYNPPWPLAPQPFRPLYDCCVVVVWDQAARLHSAAKHGVSINQESRKSKI